MTQDGEVNDSTQANVLDGFKILYYFCSFFYDITSAVLHVKRILFLDDSSYGEVGAFQEGATIRGLFSSSCITLRFSKTARERPKTVEWTSTLSVPTRPRNSSEVPFCRESGTS